MSKRKAFGPSKKKLCDLHHCKKRKQESFSKAYPGESGIKHSRIDTRNV